MADGQTGLRKEDIQEWVPWTKLFTAFMVALDPKKLLLAAGGILMMAFGWWLLATLFYLPFQNSAPSWESYKDLAYYKDMENGQAVAWRDFKSALNSWNLMHRLAGTVADSPLDKEAIRYTTADFVNDPEEYELVKARIDQIGIEIKKRRGRVKIVTAAGDQKDQSFLVNNKNIPITRVGNAKPEQVEALFNSDDRKPVLAQDLVKSYRYDSNSVRIDGIKLKIKEQQRWDDFYKDYKDAPSLKDIEDGLKDLPKEQADITKTAIKIYRLKEQNQFKPAGQLSTWPWFEDRGPNPYLLVAGMNPSQVEKQRRWPWSEGRFGEWLLTIQIPTMLEPLVKFLSPVIYLFHPATTWWIKFYLILVILWTLATWSLFGGAITRMAAVQVAQPNKSVGFFEALRFASQRYLSYFAAQLIPLIVLAVIAALLVFYGFVEVFTFAFGDVIVAGLLLPIALLMGLIMAVVLVGLVGWPMMHATISSEGSDSFDAFSRSYAYVYQAPWSYLFYCFIAVLYGAVLVFFVSLMGSLTVYLSKWGMSQTPTVMNREPSYLFMYAPTSYGWRDLLLAGSPHIDTTEVVRPSGYVDQSYVIKHSFPLWPQNLIGAVLVAMWIWLVFLMVLGFGYSYFWCAATIVYLLMRKKVDDNDIDEVHLEEEIDTPYVPPTPAPKPPEREGTMSLPMADSPAPPTAPAPAPPKEPPTSDNTTQLAAPEEPAPSPDDEGDDRPSDDEGEDDRKDLDKNNKE